MQICCKLVRKWRTKTSVQDLRAPKLTQVSLSRMLPPHSVTHSHLSLSFSFVSAVVYPSGGMLDMSNGYPSSPLGPSPSPSPVLGGHHNHNSKCKSAAHTTNSRFRSCSVQLTSLNCLRILVNRNLTHLVINCSTSHSS